MNKQFAAQQARWLVAQVDGIDAGNHGARGVAYDNIGEAGGAQQGTLQGADFQSAIELPGDTLSSRFNKPCADGPDKRSSRRRRRDQKRQKKNEQSDTHACRDGDPAPHA